MKETTFIKTIKNQPLYIVLRANTDNDVVAIRAYESVCEYMHKERDDTPLFADIYYFETLPYATLKKIARDRKKVKKCLVDTRTALFKDKETKRIEENNLVKFAKNELDILLEKARREHPDDNIQGAINEDILEIIKLFSSQQHSGITAGYLIGCLTRLLSWKPISPLTGSDDEWIEAEGMINLLQNKRCGHVFKDMITGEAFDSEGKIFSDNGGESWFSSKDSHIPVTFPYVVPDKPQKVYITAKSDNGVKRRE